MSAYVVKAGDLLPVVSATLNVDCTSATGVAFKWRLVDAGSAVSTGTCTVVTAATGEVTYAWAAGETDTGGDYLGSFVITFAGGTQTVPADGWFSFRIDDAIGDLA